MQVFQARGMRAFDFADQAVVKQATADDPRIAPVKCFCGVGVWMNYLKISMCSQVIQVSLAPGPMSFNRMSFIES